MKTLHVKKGDTVKVLTGKDRGKTGKVLRSIPQQNKVVVEGINIAKRHERAQQKRKGGIVEKAMPIHASNVAVAEEEKKSSAKK